MNSNFYFDVLKPEENIYHLADNSVKYMIFKVNFCILI